MKHSVLFVIVLSTISIFASFWVFIELFKLTIEIALFFSVILGANAFVLLFGLTLAHYRKSDGG